MFKIGETVEVSVNGRLVGIKEKVCGKDGELEYMVQLNDKDGLFLCFLYLSESALVKKESLTSASEL